VRLCSQALVRPGIRWSFVAVPDEKPFLTGNRWWRDGYARRLIVSELLKLTIYKSLFAVLKL
jgi:hypothetical protein